MCGCRRNNTENACCRIWQENRRGEVSMNIYNAQNGTDSGSGGESNCTCGCCVSG